MYLGKPVKKKSFSKQTPLHQAKERKTSSKTVMDSKFQRKFFHRSFPKTLQEKYTKKPTKERQRTGVKKCFQEGELFEEKLHSPDSNKNVFFFSRFWKPTSSAVHKRPKYWQSQKLNPTSSPIHCMP